MTSFETFLVLYPLHVDDICFATEALPLIYTQRSSLILTNFSMPVVNADLESDRRLAISTHDTTLIEVCLLLATR
jgi:hypothetical protein